MLEFRFSSGMLGFATSNTESFVFRSYWFIFWQILDWGQWWVSLALSSPLPLLDSFVDQESFQGTKELRFFMEYLAHLSSALWVYPIKAEKYFLQDKHVEWWITRVHAEMCWCSWQHPSTEPGCYVWSDPSLSATASSYKNTHALIYRGINGGWLFIFTPHIMGFV